MFIWSIRMSKRELIILSVGLAILIIAAALLLLPGNTNQMASARVSSSADRITYLEQLGWRVNAEPVSIKEVIIPQTFNAEFQSYSELLEQQGFEPERLRGQRVKLYSYSVTNYPGISDVTANLLVKDNKVVGGDISKTGSQELLHGLDPNTAAAAASIAEAQLTAVTIDRSVPDAIPVNSEAPAEQDD